MNFDGFGRTKLGLKHVRMARRMACGTCFGRTKLGLKQFMREGKAALTPGFGRTKLGLKQSELTSVACPGA